MSNLDPINLKCDNCHFNFEAIVEPDLDGACLYEGNCPNCGYSLSVLSWDNEVRKGVLQ